MAKITMPNAVTIEAVSTSIGATPIEVQYLVTGLKELAGLEVEARRLFSYLRIGVNFSVAEADPTKSQLAQVYNQKWARIFVFWLPRLFPGNTVVIQEMEREKAEADQLTVEQMKVNLQRALAELEGDEANK